MENQLIDILINSDSIAIVICGYMLIRLEQLTKKLNKLDLELSLVKAKVCKKWTLVISAVLIIMSHIVIYALNFYVIVVHVHQLNEFQHFYKKQIYQNN